MTFQITIECDNAAFDESPENEIYRILRDAASKVGNGEFNFLLFDVNGNHVGQCTLTGR